MMLNRGVVVVITDTLVSSLATSPFGSEIITLLMNDPKIEQNLTSEGVGTIAGEFDLLVFIRLLKDHGYPVIENVKIMERVACNSSLRRPEFSHVSSSRRLPRRYRPTLERPFMRDITAAIHEIIGSMGPWMARLITEETLALLAEHAEPSAFESLIQRPLSEFIINDKVVQAAARNLVYAPYLKWVLETHLSKFSYRRRIN